MSIKAVISEVLKKRHQNVPMLEQTERELLELSRQLDALRSMASDTADSANVPPDFRDATANIANQVGNLQQDITELLPKVSNVTERFRKETINICVAGRAKQGKSTILQSISGLPKEFIPVKEDAACTATKSKIYHVEGEPYARIDFYAADEFLKEMVAPSFKRLRLSPPFSLREFQNPLPPLNPEGDQMLLDKEVYSQLANVHRAFPAFQQELSTSKTIRITDIPNYVTKDNDVSMGIKTAHISTRFPNHDVTGLCLIDLPGMEAGYNFEAKLLDSLEKEVDAVVYVKRPNPKEGIWDKIDYNILDMINATLKDIQLEQWLFIVLNELEDGANTGAVQFLKDHPPANYTGLKMLTCMCKDSENVERDIFAPILRHLEQNLEKIDRVILESLARSVEQIISKATLQLGPALKFFSAVQGDGGQHEKFWELFDRFLKDSKTNLEKLVKEVHEKIYLDGIQQKFLAKVEEICDAAEQNVPIPSVQELEDEYYKCGGWFGVVEKYLHHLRAHLTKHLAQYLDLHLDELVERVFREVLVRSLSKPEGLLKMVKQQDETLKERQILEAFYHLLDPKQHQQLCQAFEYMFKFNFSYQSHFHYRVRQQMKTLDPLDNPESVTGIVPPNATAQHAPDIARGLETMYRQSLGRIRKQFINEMQADPGNAIFALVEEIRDRLARSENIDKEWRSFLYLRRAQVWPDEFNQFEQETALRQKWQNMLDVLLTQCRTLQTTLKR
ncbi:hypothetical protein U14_00635 [Candidatus Moduliflexus flocculans]|uniref:Dynamin N-terminal domain-containing protein n=1 Tax=Candidatus Moduliflexus flocculans TaxID=1499966 RepID=A0A0S6VQH5_9BACT|nr:hypothetical protein U14_00635 [Candidatus Moduliflexus flocculans]